MIKRKLVNVYTPPAERGFMGAEHKARPLIQLPYEKSDPFILLMDDVLDKKSGEPVGGPHPHAGFETVSLLLEGQMGDPPHQMKSGDFQLMTAGSGIIHTETIDTKTQMRLLQLWLNLPAANRWTTPRLQELRMADVPGKSEAGVSIKLYSGSLGDLHSPIKNYAPLIIADIDMEAASDLKLQLPADHNTFLVALEGNALVGEEEALLSQDQVGWLDLPGGPGMSELKVTAGLAGCRFIIYAARPQKEVIVSYGPFVGDTQDDIRRLYHEYNRGKMKHITSTVAD